MMERLLIELPEIRLPRDMARRVRFVALVEQHARRMGLAARFTPPRFCGYYFMGHFPVVAGGPWRVTLEATPLLAQLGQMVEEATAGQLSIASRGVGEEPDFMLVHDGHDGSCWLWDYWHGRHFLETTEPVREARKSGPSGAKAPGLLGL